MRGASYLCVSKTGTVRRTFRSHTQQTTWEVELFRSLAPMSSPLVESCCCQRMPCHASSTGWQCFWYQPVCMRGASYLCVSKTGTVRRDISLTHPTNHMGGRVLSLTSHQCRVLLVESCCCQRMPCHASSTCSPHNAFGPQPVPHDVAQRLTCASSKTADRPSGAFRSRHSSERSTSRGTELFRSLAPMSSRFWSRSC